MHTNEDIARRVDKSLVRQLLAHAYDSPRAAVRAELMQHVATRPACSTEATEQASLCAAAPWALMSPPHAPFSHALRMLEFASRRRRGHAR